MKVPKRLYYGWWVVVAGIGVGVVNGGIFIYGITVFVDPIAVELEWTYLQFSVAVAISSLLLAFFAPIVGILVDRFGPRITLLCSAIIGGSGLFWLSQVNSLASFYGAFVIVSIAAISCGSVVLTTSTANWFSRRISRAMGITTAGVGLGGPLVYLLAWLISHYGWRTALVIAAIGCFVIVSAMALVIRRPSEKERHTHLYIHEFSMSPNKQASESSTYNVPTKTSQVLRSRLFWILAVALTINFTGINGLVIHVVPYLSRSGLTLEGAALTATFVPLISIAGRLFFGWLGDVLPKGTCLAIVFGCQTIGLIAFLFSPAIWALAIFTLAFGAGYGGMIALMPAIVGTYFGRNIFGAVQGWFVSITALGGMVGPLLAGWAADTSIGYPVAWWTFIALNLIAIIMVLSLRKRPPQG